MAQKMQAVMTYVETIQAEIDVEKRLAEIGRNSIRVRLFETRNRSKNRAILDVVRRFRGESFNGLFTAEDLGREVTRIYDDESDAYGGTSDDAVLNYLKIHPTC